MKQVYLVIDDRINDIVKAFSKRNKAAAYVAKQGSEAQWFLLKVMPVE